MDSITQAVLGAAVGQAGFHKQLGRKALLWGALVGMAPDLDVLIRLPSDPFLNLIHHRGVTHSLWFGPLLGPIGGYLLWRFYGKVHELSSWIGLVIWALLTHPLLDVFTVYGTQLLAPFSTHRFSLSGVPVIDPIYTGILAMCLLFGLIRLKNKWITSSVAYLGLLVTTGYLFWGVQQNDVAIHMAEKQLKEDHVKPSQVRAYTTLFQLFLRRVVAHVDNQVWIGFASTWNPQSILWQKFDQPAESLCQPLAESREGKIMDWFTAHDYAYALSSTPQGDVLEMYDIRFGLPGSTILGPWGISASIDKTGKLNSNVEKLNKGIRASFGDVKLIFKAAFRGPDLIWQLGQNKE